MPAKMTTAFKSENGKTAILEIYDSVLDRSPVPIERFQASTRYGSTFVVAAGEKESPPIILLHGSGMNSIMWLGDIGEYSKEYRVFAVDMPGEPGRSDERQLPFGDSSYADWLSDVFTALGIEKARLVGLSLGAWLALKFAISHPENVSRLVLLAPAGIGSQRGAFLISALLHSLMGKRGMERLYRKVNGNQPMPEVMLRYQLLIGQHFNFRRETIPLFSDAELRGLTVPTMIFVGAKDVMLHSEETAKRVERLLPHVNMNVLPDAGHALIGLTSRIMDFFHK